MSMRTGDERARVLWLTKGLGRGGVERLIASSIRHFDPDRFSVEVAYILPSKDACVAEIVDAGVPVYCLGRDGASNSLWPLRLRKLVNEKRYDIVHTHMPLSAAVARASLGFRPRFVHTEHNVWQRHRAVSRWANAVTFAKNDAVIAVSQSVARSIRPPRLVANGCPPFEVLLHGINLEEIVECGVDRAGARRELGLGPDDLVIGTVGNFTKKKNQQMLLRAVARLVGRHPNTRLVLIGTGPLEDSLRRLAGHLGIGERTVFAGSRPDVPQLLPAFDVFCLSSQFEGLSIALVEAMAAGIACVATEVGGISEVVQDGVNGLLVPAGATSDLADTLDCLLGDSGLRLRLGAAGRQRATAFEIGRAARRLQDIYDEIMAA
jgi:glycosyltransferase involved in cell wall biosynthesis